jgi:hypothetical protein
MDEVRYSKCFFFTLADQDHDIFFSISDQYLPKISVFMALFIPCNIVPAPFSYSRMIHVQISSS